MGKKHFDRLYSIRLFFHFHRRVPLLAMRVRDGDFDKEERQDCEDCRLDKADEDLKCHERHRPQVRYEVERDEYEHLSRENVPEKTERERDESRKLGEKLDHADDRAYGRADGIDKKFASVPRGAEHEYAGELDDYEDDDRERER